MSNWYSSWLPGIPSINIPLPSTIQRRFLSFILKKSLGHLVKPGQLDVHQIDSQIGLGYVQVRDIELDDQAINTLLSDLPVQLTSGSISSVIARIPWPNPLTSALGFSLDSLHLTFQVLLAAPKPTPSVNLADSVASVAESFLHHELTPREEATLRETLQPDFSTSLSDEESHHTIPGSMDPFLSAPEDEEFDHDIDPAGVSIFATLIERLLARFEFDAVETKITLVHPGHTSFTVSIPNIKYGTESRSGESEAAVGETRTLAITGLNISSHGLRCVPSSPSPSSPVQEDTDDARTVSPASSSSSLDENAESMMSQSLAFLPPRPVSPTSSVASSMYESAISTARSGHGDDDSPTASPVQPAFRPSRVDETIISFGAEPILLKLATPPSDAPTALGEKLRFSISTGVIACALRPFHLRSVLELADLLRLHQPPQPDDFSPVDEPSKSAWNTGLETAIAIRGVVLLLVPTVEETFAASAFFIRPLVPPRLDSGYLRFHLDNITTNITNIPSQPPIITPIATLAATLSELSLFYFYPSMLGGEEMAASPILITDLNLPSQYPSTVDASTPQAQLPTFELIDWTEGMHNYKTSIWRTKPSHRQKPSTGTAVDLNTTEPYFAVRVTGTLGASLQITVAPLHFFIDMDQLLDRRGFFLVYAAEVTDRPVIHSLDDDQEYSADTPPASRKDTEREIEQRRFNDSVLKDLDLDLDYGLTQPVKEETKLRLKVTPTTPPRSKKTDAVNVIVDFPMIRIQVRVPPPPGRNRRSGALVVDLHKLSFQTSPPPVRLPARFSSSADEGLPESDLGDTVLAAECQRIILAFSSANTTKATSVISLGPLLSASEEFEADSAPLCPRVRITKSELSEHSSTVVTLDIPSTYVVLSKKVVDGAQYWADDISQLFERLSKEDNNSDTEKGESRDASLIGSRFFTGSRPSDSDSFGSNGPRDSETILKLGVSEAFIRILLPRVADGTVIRPFEIVAFDLDGLVELKPKGRDETAVTLVVMTLEIKDYAPSGEPIQFLSLTAPRGISSKSNPLLQLRFTSLVVPETTSKESRIKLVLADFTFNVYCDFNWVSHLGDFAKAPPGAFESVVPSERTRISVKILNGSVRAFAPVNPGSIVVYMGELNFSTELVGDSSDTSFDLDIGSLSLLGLDNVNDVSQPSRNLIPGALHWKGMGYALIAEILNMSMVFQNISAKALPDVRVIIKKVGLRLHLCADTMSSMGAFISDVQSAFKPPPQERPPKVKRTVTMVSEQPAPHRNLMASVDDLAFKQIPAVGGHAPDMIFDDLPRNLDYLDESFGTAAGLRELRDDDLDEFEVGDAETTYAAGSQPGTVSVVGGETIRMLRPEGLNIIENYFDDLPAEATDSSTEFGETTFRLRIHNANVELFLYDGYDWAQTRKTIENEVKDMRRKLTKIRQLVADGQTHDPSIEDPSKLLFNSFYVGLEQDLDEFEPDALIAAIDDQLRDDAETATQSSWQTLKSPTTAKPRVKSVRVNGKRLTRSKGPSMEFRLMGVEAEVDQYDPKEPTVSRTFATVRDLEILDHIKTSTWKKFLTELRSDSHGNVRETDSNMVRVELRSVHPVAGHASEEARLRAKILPLRLHVDQDALDFLKKFFSFKDPHASAAVPESDGEEIYFQLAEMFPVDLKLDYKPRRVDYRALRDGQTIALMNFFHFDAAEMTLRHITLNGITGWPRVFDMLNDLWTPDVKATQLVDVISGVAPIRSVVNVGSGVADLVLLPIAQYKKDGRIVRGVQKGTKAFVKSTATEAIKLGARLATGTQVILEHAEGMLEGHEGTITAEALQALPVIDDEFLRSQSESDEDADADIISKYADQPLDIREGVESAYKSLRKNLNSAAQTILAVPMEVYERSSDEGPVRAVIRAVPIAILKPMIGASEAVSKTLLGLHNTLDPSLRHDNDAKYKHR